jgi:hypothetical protein
MLTKGNRILIVVLLVELLVDKSQCVEPNLETARCPTNIGFADANSSEEKPTLLTFYIDERTTLELQDENFI